MRITTTPSDEAVDLARVDLSSTTLYVEGDAHQVWRALRRQRPLFWNQRSGGRGFWVVTRHVDVRRVLREHETFSSEGGTALDMVGHPDPAAGAMMHATDPPCHQRLREQIERPLLARQVVSYAPMVRALVREALAPARRSAPWDAAADLTRLPVAVMVRLMDLPSADVDRLVHMAYASVAPQDEHYRTGSPDQTLQWAHSAIVEYFARHVDRRRRAPAADLLSHLVTMQVGGRRLTDVEAVVNCYSLLVGGVVTTAQVVSAALIALVEHGGGRGRWPSVTTDSIVEEALRWSSPTTHFMRRARRDVELHRTQIRKGEPVTAWIGSANRDEDVFDSPYAFDPTRRPNRHIAFGNGPHRCVGRQLARMALQEIFEHFATGPAGFELAGSPVHLHSNLIAGVVELPIRFHPRLSDRREHSRA